ncbi:arylsulfatase B-like [Coccinella septempunctata]|uniref:arylsulfatase B-like n=1 Tax=Coccinella septempunctata TaxID=41139 RepID=UPI001D08885C|nr:arylsulfatase B-like [Coccinella septempunctata]
MKIALLLGLFLVSCAQGENVKNRPPNIVMILADDMGSNDVSYRGSDQFTTSNIDALGYNGVILDRHYTQAICTPSRAALLTGKNPSRLGLQGSPISAGEDRHLPRNVETLPSLLKNLGYDTHLVGKWHLGAARREDTPTRRGFDSHYGYWNGYVGYYTYEVNASKADIPQVLRGFDLRQGFTDAWEDRGTYATDLFTRKTLEVIEKQDKNVPMFLMVAHLGVHTGDDEAVEVKDEKSMNETFGYIEDMERRRYVDALKHLDDSVGSIVEKLQEQDMLNNTIVVFMSDNGAPVNGMFHNGGSNYPLRGQKSSLHEGGVRNAAVVYSPLLETKNYVYTHPVHITDWLPTLYGIAGNSYIERVLMNLHDEINSKTTHQIISLDKLNYQFIISGGDVTALKNLDGVDQWQNLSGNRPNRRKTFLVNIDEAVPYWAVIGFEGRYKLMNGTRGDLDIYGREPEVPSTLVYDVSSVLDSAANKGIQKSTPGRTGLTPTTIETLRKTASSLRRNKKCQDVDRRTKNEMCSSLCLFDLFEDPCETESLINDPTKKSIVETLMVDLEKFRKEMIPQTNCIVDVASDPAKYNGTWCTWKDDELCVKTPLKMS